MPSLAHSRARRRRSPRRATARQPPAPRAGTCRPGSGKTSRWQTTPPWPKKKMPASPGPRGSRQPIK
eukprot:1955975-Pyramimonas_sp.AAC.1